MANTPYRNYLAGETVIASNGVDHAGHEVIEDAEFDPVENEWMYKMRGGAVFPESRISYPDTSISEPFIKPETKPAPVTHDLFTEAELYTLKAQMAAQIFAGMNPHHRSGEFQELAELSVSGTEYILAILNCEFEDRANGGA